MFINKEKLLKAIKLTKPGRFQERKLRKRKTAVTYQDNETWMAQQLIAVPL